MAPRCLIGGLFAASLVGASAELYDAPREGTPEVAVSSSPSFRGSESVSAVDAASASWGLELQATSLAAFSSPNRGLGNESNSLTAATSAIRPGRANESAFLAAAISANLRGSTREFASLATNATNRRGSDNESIPSSESFASLPGLANASVAFAANRHGGRCESARTPQETKCSGCPPMLNGKLCSSTTRFDNRNLGACGCGNQYRSSGPNHVRTIPLDYWTLTGYTAAMNCASLDPSDPREAWCPTKCGSCFELCSTGGVTTTAHGAHRPEAGVCKVFKVVDRCGDGYDNPGPNWCSQKVSYQHCQSNPHECKKSGNTNWFGYSAHFDLQDSNHQILSGLGWDNIEVTFAPVSCDKWEAPPDVETCDGCEY